MDSGLWTYRDETLGEIDIVGFDVEARDGFAGRINEATYELGKSHLVVDTGHWIFGSKAVVPAGLVEDVNLERELVRVAMSKAQMRDAPRRLGRGPGVDDAHRAELERHYMRHELLHVRDVF
jgi:hypothetical protein